MPRTTLALMGRLRARLHGRLDVATLLYLEGLEVAITRLSSREFNHDTGRAKSAARRGPVFITDYGRPTHVLLTFEDYQRLTGHADSIIDLLGVPADETDVESPTTHPRDLARPADLS